MTKPILVQLVQRLAPGGLETLVLELSRGLTAHFDVRLVSLEGEATALASQWPRLAGAGIEVIALDKQPGWDLSAAYRLGRLFRELKPACIHTHHIGPLVYSALSRWQYTPPRHVHTEHDAWHFSAESQVRLTRVALAICRPTLVADARGVASVIRDRGVARQARVIHNGVDLNRFRPQGRAESRALFGLDSSVWIGCAGRLVEEKGQADLIAAMARLPAKCKLAIAGVGPLKGQLERQVTELGLEDRVQFLGLVDQMAHFYSALDLFCLPSHHEGFPMTLIEAQACDVPVVASHIGACDEAVCARTGVLTPAGDPSRLADTLRQKLFAPLNFSPRNFAVRIGDAEAMANHYHSLMEAPC